MGRIIARGPEGGVWPIFDVGKILESAPPRLFVFSTCCVSGGFDERFLCACISLRTSLIWCMKEEQTSSLSTLWAVTRVSSPSPSFMRCAAFFNTRGKMKSRTCSEGSGSESTNSPSSNSCSCEGDGLGTVVFSLWAKLSSNWIWDASLMFLEELLDLEESCKINSWRESFGSMICELLGELWLCRSSEACFSLAKAFIWTF